MNDINADLGPDPQTGDATVESGRLRPIVRLVGRSNARWPAGLVLAMIAVLAASGLAFGAQMLPALQSGNPAAIQMDGRSLSATPLVIDGLDDPTDLPSLAPEEPPTSGPTSPGLEPTLNPTESPTPTPTYVPTATPRPASQPTLPPSGYLSFAVQAEGGCARLNWASFDDPSRAYYRIVRSTDAGVEWPLGAGDILAGSVRDASQLTMLDCPAAGTYTYRVFVDKATTAGYVVLVSSHSLTISLSGPTPTPTVTPVPLDMGPLNVTANPNGTYTLTWNAYTGPLAISTYALCYTTNENVSFGYVEHFGGVIGVSKTATSWTGTFPWAATLKVKIEALYYPPSGTAQKAGETQVVVIPYTGATPTPPATPTATPTPVPVDMGPLNVTANHDGTFTITWNAYTGPLSIYSYALCYTTNENVSFGSVEHFGGVIGVSKTATGWTGAFPWQATLKVKVEAIYNPPSGSAQKAGETQVSTVVNTAASPAPTTQP